MVLIMKTKIKTVKLIKAFLFFTLAFMFIYLKLVIKVPFTQDIRDIQDLYIIANLRYIVSLVFTLLGLMEIIEVIDKWNI